MSIFDIKKILNEAIACQTLNKVGYGGLPICTENLLVDILQTPFMRYLFQVAYRTCIINELNETTVPTIRDY